jgi:hypothetical protein
MSNKKTSNILKPDEWYVQISKVKLIQSFQIKKISMSSIQLFKTPSKLKSKASHNATSHRSSIAHMLGMIIMRTENGEFRQIERSLIPIILNRHSYHSQFSNCAS